MQTDGLKYIKWLSSHRQAYGFSPRIYNDNKSLCINTPASYKSKYTFLRNVDSLALANVQMHLNTAFKQYFKDMTKKSRNKCKHPKFKSKKKAKRSYTTNCINSNIVVYGL